MNEHWKDYPDYWLDFELREVIESIWGNYEEKVHELDTFLSQVDDSKSILTLPHRLKRTWLRLKWDVNAHESVYAGAGRLLDIPRLVDDNYNDVSLPFRVDSSRNAVILEASDEELEPYKTIEKDGHWSIKLWAPVYYVHNPVTNKFFAPLLGIDTLEETYNIAYGVRSWSEVYHRIVKGLWYVFVNGPTIENIRIGLFILFNIPFALRSGIVTRKVQDTGYGTSIMEIVTDDGTDLNDYWEFPSSFYSPYDVGDRVEEFTPLITGGVEIIDYLNSPNWWEILPQGPMKEKVALLERFCTCLIKIDAVSFFREQLVSSGEIKDAIPELYESFTNRILPTFVKASILLYQAWVDVVDEPKEDFLQSGTLKWGTAPYKTEDGEPVQLKWMPNINERFSEIDPYAKFDGSFRHKESFVDEDGRVILVDGELKFDSLPEKHVLFDRRRLWVPVHSWLYSVELEDGTSVPIRSRGHNWVDVEYDGNGPIHVIYYTFAFPGGLDAWTKEETVHPENKLFTLHGEDVIAVQELAVGVDILREGVDYTIEYNRLNVGEGEILLHFVNDYPEVKLTSVIMPYDLKPVDENGEFIDGIANRFFQDDLKIRGMYVPGGSHRYPSLAKYPSEQLVPRGA